MTDYKAKKQPQFCENKTDIRNEIDAIDKEILKLLGLRFEYVKHIVKFKEKSADSIIASKRREEVISKRREWAVENGLNPDVIEKMFRNLIKYFIAEEMKIIKI